jgi:hypothetical protein
MSAWEKHEANDDGLSVDERIQLCELCVLIVISEFLENNRKTAYVQHDLIDDRLSEGETNDQ